MYLELISCKKKVKVVDRLARKIQLKDQIKNDRSDGEEDQNGVC